MIANIIQAQEKERLRISLQMHDGPAQSMSNLVLRAEICQRMMDRDLDQARAELGALKSAINTTLQDTRRFIFDLRPMILMLEANLRKGIGAIGTDGVLLRSFSALTLSVVAARDSEAPFLSAEEYATLLDAALAYFHDERDTRGFDAAKGWMHSAAHTSDLLKFLARNPRLPANLTRTQVHLSCPSSCRFPLAVRRL